MKIAFFDFDGTLTRHDSFIGFAKFCVGKCAYYKALLKSLPALIQWKLGLKSNSEAKQELFSHLYRGLDYARFKESGYKYAKFIERDLRKDVFEILNHHKQSGHKIVIVSASIGDWIRKWALDNGVDHVIATEVEIDEVGKISGNFRTRNCHGAEKVSRILELFPNFEEFETWGYGDSRGDEAMLSKVSHSKMV
ncbi:MAG: haloacid dehalogenase-like hydrolase [Muribaculaceae bacterium]|nr:haloacid dehalogenase-like hydrolase [Muribaculaceae bacterium]